MMAEVRIDQYIGSAEALILAVLARYTRRSGAQLCRITRLGPGALYPALARLEHDNKIIGEWDDGPYHGRYPRTRRYRLIEQVVE